MIRWLAKLERLNQRWLYLGGIVLLLVPFVVTIPLPPGGASMATRGLYDMIESCPPDKVVLINSSWDMGSRAENHAQLECVVRHLCRRHIRFVVISLGRPFGPQFAASVIEPIAEKAGYKYGRDWVNTGFVNTEGEGVMGAVIDGLCDDFHQVRPTDVNGTPADRLPLLKRVRSARDIHLIYSITYQPSVNWISFANAQYGTPVAFGCMSIAAPSYFTYIDSGQLCGMLVGNRGAAEYEGLIDARSTGTRLIGVASFGNCIVIVAALLGNVGAWAALRARRKGR